MERFFISLGILGFIFFFLFGIAQIYVGMLGIDYHFGSFWAYFAVFLAIFLRILLPVTIGSYFGAVDVLGWEWFFALAFATPGIIFILPATVGVLISSILESITRRTQ